MDIETQFQKVVSNLGFRNEDQFFRMVAKVDMDNERVRKRYKDWQYNDGTINGLRRILKKQKK